MAVDVDAAEKRIASLTSTGGIAGLKVVHGSGEWTDLETAACGYPHGVLLSSDSGASWTKADMNGVNPIWSSIASSADGTKLVVSAYSWGYAPGLYLSNNSGASWVPAANTNRIWQGVASSSDGTKLAAIAHLKGITADEEFQVGNIWISIQRLGSHLD